MKISRGFIIALLLLFALLVLIEIKIPRKFTWEEPSFSSIDPNPYGSQLVDSFLIKSTHGRYEVKPGTLYEAFEDSTDLNKTMVFVDSYSFYGPSPGNDDEIEMFLSILERGQNIVLISSWVPADTVLNELGLSWDYSSIYSIDIRPGYEETVHWVKDSVYKAGAFIFKTNSSENIFIARDDTIDAPKASNHKVIIRGQNNEIKGMTLNYGKGKLVYVIYSNVFLNYTLLQPGGAILLLRIFSQAGDAPMVRYDPTITDDYIEENERSQSPLRVFLENRSLRWAVYITLLAIVLSLIFTARRRQRVIPVVEEPKNQTLAMVKHIGLMHFRHHDNASIVRDYYKHFTHELLRKALIDIDDDQLIDESILFLVTRSGMKTDDIKDNILKLKNIKSDSNIILSDQEAMRLINFINDILKDL